jgi:hypothetical protein
MTKPADLKVGDRIHAEGINWLTVIAEPFVDCTEQLAAKLGISYHPEDDRVHIDIEPAPGADIWDCGVLADAAGAEAAEWLGMTPTLRYRLFFKPDADVKTGG